MSEAQQFAWGSSLAMRAPLPAVCEPDEEYGQPRRGFSTGCATQSAPAITAGPSRSANDHELHSRAQPRRSRRADPRRPPARQSHSQGLASDPRFVSNRILRDPMQAQLSEKVTDNDGGAATTGAPDRKRDPLAL